MDIFQAIADPTRRSIVAQLIKQPAQSITHLCENQSINRQAISRQAITKHLKILINADVIRTEQNGRHSLHTLNPEPLKEIADWLAPIAKLWDQRLANLQTYLKDQQEGK
jgi:DNA-binding transcriptional ArsR family regulator